MTMGYISDSTQQRIINGAKYFLENKQTMEVALKPYNEQLYRNWCAFIDLIIEDTTFSEAQEILNQ